MHTPAARALALRTSGVTYPSGIEHVRAVRADLHALLRDCARADDVILCASELAANAVLHCHSRLPGVTFTVRATVSPGSIACRNPVLAADRARKRDELLAATEKLLAPIIARVAASGSPAPGRSASRSAR